MKFGLALVIAITLWIVAFGSPFAEQPERGHYYQSPEPILPMTFGHVDHATVGCIECHHNYDDDTGDLQCMVCHVTNEDVWPLLEQQFHDLCRDCHRDLAAKGEKSGPRRQCNGCHLGDEVP